MKRDNVALLIVGTLAVLLLAFVAMTQTVHAAGARMIVCMPWKTMEERLTSAGERPVGGGLTLKGDAAVQLWTADEGRTFSVVMVGREGVGCLIGFGKDWQPVAGKPEQKPKGDPT